MKTAKKRKKKLITNQLPTKHGDFAWVRRLCKYNFVPCLDYRQTPLPSIGAESVPENCAQYPFAKLVVSSWRPIPVGRLFTLKFIKASELEVINVPIKCADNLTLGRAIAHRLSVASKEILNHYWSWRLNANWQCYKLMAPSILIDLFVVILIGIKMYS